MYEHEGYQVPDHVPRELVKPFQPALDPRYVEDPFGYYAQLYEGPDIFFTPVDVFGQGPGNWICTRAEQYRHVLQSHETFCNDMSDTQTGWPNKLIPLELDPPEHIKYRSLIAPIFAPRAIDKREANVRRIADELIDAVVDKGACEFNEAFARPFPVTVFMGLMGLPEAETDRFMDWENNILHGLTAEARQKAGGEIAAYLADLIHARRADPQDDLVSTLTQAQVDGAPVPQQALEDMCMLLFLAGLDTVSLALGSSFRFLAMHPEHRRKLAEDPSLITGASEELLRAFALGGSRRKARHDTEILGVTIKKGEWVSCPNVLASRDPRAFPDAHELDFERAPNAHYAFAAGPHRCAGSHLARREIRIALERWFARIPEFRIPKGEKSLGFAYGNMGFESVPLEWDVKG